jgi:hypothetical protein
MTDLEIKYRDQQLQLMKLDKFFTMFLDKFSSKMSPEKTNTPIWKLYNEKTKEYNELYRDIRITEYYIKREANV